MKTNNRIRRNSGTNSTPPQVPNKPDAPHQDRAQLTIDFLSNGTLSDSCELTEAESEYVNIYVRNAKVSLADLAKSALLGHIDANMAAAKPSEPVVEMPKQKTERLKRQSLIAEHRPSMEEAVQRTQSLLELFARMDCVLSDRGEPNQGSKACGFNLWSWDCCKTLHAAWLAAHDANFKDTAITTPEAKITAIRKLGAIVGKARVLLLMLAHDLSSGGIFDDYEFARFSGDLPDEETSPYVSLAADCAEFLEASYYVDFGKNLPMNQFERNWIEKHFAQKFAPALERRAA